MDGVSISVDPGEVLYHRHESPARQIRLHAGGYGASYLGRHSTADRMLFQGKDIQNLSASERRKLIGKDVATDLQGTDLQASIRASRFGFQIEEVLQIHMGLDKKARRARAIKALQLVGLPDPGKAPVEALSAPDVWRSVPARDDRDPRLPAIPSS